MTKIAVFPGSFDPVTKGHESIVLRALPLFDEIIVAIGNNSTKTSMFTLEQRKQWLTKVFLNVSQVKIADYKGLTIDFCRQQSAGFILRGIRNASDYDYECAIANTHKQIFPGIETVFLAALPKYSHIRSNILKEILRHGGDIKDFVPDGIVIK